ncbi:MAG TPA: uridine diphosphate-N-acetylglucosamine-binding protein YvcK [Nitrospiria bacterium]|nr:uridine diphosphate-N-acetylglucosamine-binding protein YvcK [Nitrospiria bacterium]
MGEQVHCGKIADLGSYRLRRIPKKQVLSPDAHLSTLRVVALGGGTGLPILLCGLKSALFPPERAWELSRDLDRLTAIVTVADDGGSSGRLRRAYPMLSPGDIRNCLLALSNGDPTLAAVFNFRFNGHGDVAGHNLGNLILTALSELEGNFFKAIEWGSKILEIRGKVLPCTLDTVDLLAEFSDGSYVEGESQIATIHRPIRRVRIHPEYAQAFPEARAAILAADLIVIGPGSLYTSLIPNLLIKGIANAIADSKARVILVMNLMTEPGETDDYTAADHLQALRLHAPQVRIHDVLLNNGPIPDRLTKRYAAEGSRPVFPEVEFLKTLGCRPVVRDFLGVGPKLHHDSHKLAQAILTLTTDEQTGD